VNDDSIVDYRGDANTCSSWYDDHPEDCDLYNTDDFIAASLCCACGGGSPIPNSLRNLTMNVDSKEITFPLDLPTYYQFEILAYVVNYKDRVSDTIGSMIVVKETLEPG
jgi:hypothetical protein